MKKDNFPELPSEKELKRSKRKMYAQIWAITLLPVIFIWILYFNSEWLQNILGTNFHVARGIITFSLLSVVLIILAAIKACSKLFAGNK